MERKDFLSKACACVAGSFMLSQVQAGTQGDAPEDEFKTPCNERFAFAQKYVKRMMDLFHKHLDESTRVSLVRDMGATCACGAYGDLVENRSLVPYDEFVKKLEARQEGEYVFWEYTGSPWTGIKVSDGYCLCPLTEKGPEGLSGLYCECSVGYVGYMFERFTGQKVEVELLESLKRGGKGCRFRIRRMAG